MLISEEGNYAECPDVKELKRSLEKIQGRCQGSRVLGDCINAYILLKRDCEGDENMCFCIGMEDLTANAFIESMRRAGKTFLTFKEVEDYGSRVVELLNEKGEKAVLILSRENTNNLFRIYPDFFRRKNVNGEKGIELQKEVTLEDLIREFRGYLALDVLMAFVNENSVQALGV